MIPLGRYGSHCIAAAAITLLSACDIPGASHPIVKGALSGAVSGALNAYLETGVVGQVLKDQCDRRAALDLDQQAAVDAFRPELAEVCGRIAI